jgi:PhoPQ-activated pathogenicity-related protein
MMMDWTNLYYDRLTNNTGESHILIVPNTDHILVTNLYGEFATIGSFIRSIMSGHKSRPSFKYTYEPTDGTIKVFVSDRDQVK